MVEHIVPNKSSLKRMNSNPYSKASEDDQSVFISGNLEQVSKHVEDLFSDDEFLFEDNDEDQSFVSDFSGTFNYAESDPDMLTKADSILYNQFGVKVLQIIASAICNGDLSSTDLVLQALAYKSQRIVRGKKGIRYKDSWGMFWLGIRTLIKGRGLVPFLDHFELPSKLSTFKPKLMDICGLNSETLGKPGLQA